MPNETSVYCIYSLSGLLNFSFQIMQFYELAVHHFLSHGSVARSTSWIRRSASSVLGCKRRSIGKLKRIAIKMALEESSLHLNNQTQKYSSMQQHRQEYALHKPQLALPETNDRNNRMEDPSASSNILTLFLIILAFIFDKPDHVINSIVKDH